MIAEIGGAKIWFEDSGGTGAPLVLLHAGTGSTRMWRHQVMGFSAAGYRVVAYDRRGYGRSSEGDGVAVEDLALLLENLKIDKPHILGTAAGGIVAFDFALSFPGHLRSLVVANSIGGVQDPEYLELQARLRPKPHFDALPAEVRELGPSYRAANPQGVREWLELERMGKHAGISSLPKTRSRITFAALEKIVAPTLLLSGDGDLYAPPSVLRMFGKRIGKATTVVLPECGHSAFWEQPERFNRAVLDFLGKN